MTAYTRPPRQFRAGRAQHGKTIVVVKPSAGPGQFQGFFQGTSVEMPATPAGAHCALFGILPKAIYKLVGTHPTVVRQHLAHLPCQPFNVGNLASAHAAMFRSIENAWTAALTLPSWLGSR